MKQIELFGTADLAQPAKPPPPRPAPVPERVRWSLGRHLHFLRGAQFTPWPDWELAYKAEHFAALADELGPEEAPDWKRQWDAEIARLAGTRAT